MNSPTQTERPRYTLVKGIVTTMAGWAIGLALMFLIRGMFDSPLSAAIGQGISFLGFFIGFYWLSEYLRWRRSGNREIFQGRPFRHHLVAAFAGGIVLTVVTFLTQK